VNSVLPTNPAGRLFLLLNAAQSKPDGFATKQVWQEVFEIQKSPDDLFIHLGNLQKLTAEVKYLVTRYLGELSNHYLTMFSNIERAVKATNLDAQWANSKGFLSEATLTELRFTWIALDTKLHEKTLDQDQLQELLASVQGLMGDVLAGDIDLKLKEIIVDLLHGIEESIFEYKIRGAASLQKTLERTIGTIRYNYNLFQSKEEDPFVKRLWDIMVKINDLTTFGLNTPLLLTGTSFVLKALTT